MYIYLMNSASFPAQLTQGVSQVTNFVRFITVYCKVGRFNFIIFEVTFTLQHTDF